MIKSLLRTSSKVSGWGLWPAEQKLNTSIVIELESDMISGLVSNYIECGVFWI